MNFVDDSALFEWRYGMGLKIRNEVKCNREKGFKKS